LIGGAGSTGRSERVLTRLIEGTGAAVLQVRSFWLWRPNDETRSGAANRAVALERANALGRL
jgi:hypothetical protein